MENITPNASQAPPSPAPQSVQTPKAEPPTQKLETTPKSEPQTPTAATTSKVEPPTPKTEPQAPKAEVNTKTESPTPKVAATPKAEPPIQTTEPHAPKAETTPKPETPPPKVAPTPKPETPPQKVAATPKPETPPPKVAATPKPETPLPKVAATPKPETPPQKVSSTPKIEPPIPKAAATPKTKDASTQTDPAPKSCVCGAPAKTTEATAKPKENPAAKPKTEAPKPDATPKGWKPEANKAADKLPPKPNVPPDQKANMVILKEGFKVDGRWKVTQLLGKGSFGAVYKCEDDKKEFRGFMAIKSESTKTPEQSQVLKLEVAVLKAMRGSKHACKLFARGRNDEYNYIVMSVLGPSLADLRRKQPDFKFSVSTTTKLIYQSCRALKDMHNIDWIHRDVKPANFAMGGCAKTRRNVYIFDFGLSRRFRSEDLKLRPGREEVKFRGTKRYCSIMVHKKEEFGRHDDLITILYMIVEFIKGRLPWNELGDGKELLKMKEETGTTIYQGLPPWLPKVHDHLHSLKYDNQPDYAMLETPLLDWIYSKGHNKKPLEWETGLQMCYQSVGDTVIGDQGKSEDVKLTDVGVDPKQFKSHPIIENE